MWKPVVGYEGLYEVSDDGFIRSLDRIVYGGRWSETDKRFARGQILSESLRGSKEGNKYPSVSLCRDGESKILRPVHQLVLEAFVGPRPSDMLALHKDGNRYNCKADNLYWGTQSQNQHDAIKHGTSKSHFYYG